LTSLYKLEFLFFRVLEDLKSYLNDLTLVGGWLPYVYTKFLWKNIIAKPVTTVDVDFGFGEVDINNYPNTIFDRLSSLNYDEHHLKLGKLYPVVLLKEGKIPVDFITYPEIADEVLEKFISISLS